MIKSIRILRNISKKSITKKLPWNTRILEKNLKRKKECSNIRKIRIFFSSVDYMEEKNYINGKKYLRN